ncbi:MAG: sulfite exporter TauE/SafE family protein [Flavobacteriales bacterium]|nr:sulfite exporter TauE/SafE family protein [Flavobacteriales bacterium]
MFLTAFAIGALGSFHCIGMCGPIALSVPMGGKHGWAGIIRGLAYNFGRVSTYALLGLIVGFLGKQLSFGNFQQGLSIAVGVLILAFLILPKSITKKVDPTSKFAQLFLRLKGTFQGVFKSKSPVGPLALGLVNGLLPCGLVYVGLAGALAMSAPLQSAAFMAAFGLGTVPMMITVILAGDLISVQWRTKVRKLLPVMFAVMGVLFILRGMNLGIPYVSPKMEMTPAGQTTECHTP